jgi:hypothetical protein
MSIADIEKRIADWSLLPVGNGEGLQVLRYQNGQKYEPHWVRVGRCSCAELSCCCCLDGAWAGTAVAAACLMQA